MQHFYRKTISFLALGALFLFSGLAQNKSTLKYCGTTEAEQKFFAENPQIVPIILKERDDLEKHTKEYFQRQKPYKSGTVYVIPIVFHILHDEGSENISDDQIYDAVRILNEDFRKKNADSSATVAAFKPLSWDAEIEFRLAQKDPNGNCTNGIDRIWTSETYIGDDGSKLNQWPRNKYLNVWTAKTLNSGAAGYSYLPASTSWNPAIDGVMILHSYVGSIGTGNSGTDGALTHEVGHWLNLMHPWGSTNQPGQSCGGTDGVADTPETEGWTNCDLAGSVCNPPVVENVQNFMEYSYCETMFTKDQTTRMRSALTSSTASRNNLWTTANLAATGTDVQPYLCAVDFSTPYTTVCAGKPVQFYDGSYNASPTIWNWTFTGASPTASTLEDPLVTYSNPGTYSVSLSATDGSNTYAESKTSYITVLPTPGKSSPYSEGFESGSFPNIDWSIINQDNTSYKWDLKAGVAYSGTKCLKMNNFGNDTNQTDHLLSGTIDLSNMSSASVKFRVAYCQRNSTTNDKLTLYVSTNCGQTWSPRFSKNGATLGTASILNQAFTPSSASQWVEYTATLAGTSLIENFRMKFSFDADGGNNLYLDDINITGAFNAVPILVSPSNNSTNIANNVTLDWKSAGNVNSYEYQVDVTTAFNSGSLITGTKNFISLSSDSSDTEYQTSGLNAGTKYYWRVRSVTNGTPSAWSSTWNFTVGSTTLSAPLQISPVDNATNQPVNVKLDWGSVNNIDSYDYQLDTSSLFNSPVLISGNNIYISGSSGNTDTEYQTSNLLPGKNYYWRVRSNLSGNASSWSSTWTFKVLNAAGIDESGANKGWSIYPNPNNGIFYIAHLSSSANSYQVKVYSLIGEVVHQSEIKNSGQNKIEINLANLETGIYFVMVNTENQSQVKKIAISR